MPKFAVDPKISENDKIVESDFTIGWVLDSLMENDKVFNDKFGDGKHVLKKFEAKDISGGKGMFSIVIKIWLHIEDEKNNEQVYTTILKIPSVDNWKSIGKDVSMVRYLNILD